MPTLEDKLRALTTIEEHPVLPSPEPPEHHQRQRRTMVVALGLLLVALAVVIIRDRDFWFPPTPEPVADELGGEESSASQAKSTKPARPASTKPRSKAVTTAAQTAKTAAPLISAERRALPPLQVEVVAGDGRHTVQAGTNAVHVDLHTRTPGRVIEDERVAAQVSIANLNTQNKMIIE